MLIYRGEKRKLFVDMTESLNGATPTGSPTVTIHRARGMAAVPELLTTPAAAFEGNVAVFWVDAATWTEVGRFKVRASCTADSGEVPVEREVPLLIQ